MVIYGRETIDMSSSSRILTSSTQSSSALQISLNRQRAYIEVRNFRELFLDHSGPVARSELPEID